MTKQLQDHLGKTLWNIADRLRGTMSADDFRDYMLSFLFLRYLSDNYEESIKKELGKDYPTPAEDENRTALQLWYDINKADVVEFEKQMRRKIHYVVQPDHLWSNIAEMARVQDEELLNTLQAGFKYIENKSFDSTFSGLFSEINLNSEKLGKSYKARNSKLVEIVDEIAKGLEEFSADHDALGDAYEYLISKFASGSGKKAGEFYTPQQISDILSAIVTLDGHNPESGQRKKIDKVLDFTCGSGSLLLNIRNRMVENGNVIGKIYGQEKTLTTYNLARMNMLLHGVKDTEFEIFRGDTLTNEWDILRELNPSKKPEFDAIVANPPFSLRWQPDDTVKDDIRFKNYGVAPKSAADFAFLLHGFHYLKENGVMAIILPHGVLFRGGAEAKIRKKLIDDGHIDTIIGLPANLFYSTGIPVCIIILKKCVRNDDILFINASEHFTKDKKQNRLRRLKDGDEVDDFQKIINTYKNRPEKEERYARRVSIDEIRDKNDYNLNITRYVSTAKPEPKIDLGETHQAIVAADKEITKWTKEHNKFLKELGLPLLPTSENGQ